MSDKVAILQMADQGPAESTAIMLRAAGYRVYLPNKALRDELRRIGHKLVLSPRDLTAGMGYDPLVMEEIGLEGMETCDLYCDVKAHRYYSNIVRRWPRLEGKVLWTRINGGEPEHVVNERGDHGDEVNPPCPILTPDLWYRRPGPWSDKAYACWCPFRRFDEYYPVHGRAGTPHVSLAFQPPVCLIHGVGGWGYRDLIDNMRALGVRFHGVAAPDGLVPHKQIPAMLSRSLALVHLKSSDAPGFSLYEAMAAACPLVVTRRLIWRSAMQELLIPGKTCLVFDRETHDGLTARDVACCTAEVKGHLELLQDPKVNRTIGMAGRERLREVMWSESKTEDVEGLRAFLGRHYAATRAG